MFEGSSAFLAGLERPATAPHIRDQGVTAARERFGLRNDTQPRPFQDLLAAEYRLVYLDDENRLYAHRSIANKPGE